VRVHVNVRVIGAQRGGWLASRSCPVLEHFTSRGRGYVCVRVSKMAMFKVTCPR